MNPLTQHQLNINRRHFFGAAIRAMEHFLIDRSRGRKALKRGGGKAPISLSILAGELADYDRATEIASRGLIGAIDDADNAAVAGGHRSRRWCHFCPHRHRRAAHRQRRRATIAATNIAAAVWATNTTIATIAAASAVDAAGPATIAAAV